jgi:hypothetical protein
MKAISVNRLVSSSSILSTSRIKDPGFATTLTVGCRTGGGGAGRTVCVPGSEAAFRDLLNPRLAITDLGLVALDWDCSMAGCDCTCVVRKDNAIRNQEIAHEGLYSQRT